MKQGRTINELAIEIERRRKTKKDYILPTESLRMSAIDQSLNPKEAEIKLWIGNEVNYGVTSQAHGQIADYFRIPRAYYNRMLAESPELLARNVNQWIADNDKMRMVRTMDNKVRALLSNSYRRFENEDFAEAILDVLMDLKLDIMSCEITERRLYIKAVDPSVTRELKATFPGAEWGDGQHHVIKTRTACPAVTLSNSETGDGRLSVLGGLYSGWCTNLASFGERSLQKTHLGARHDLTDGEALYELLSDETKRLTDEAVWHQVRDVVRATFDRLKFNELVDKVEGAIADKIEGNVSKVVHLAAKKFGATGEQEQSILKHLIDGGSLSRFGLHNAVTSMAQDVEDYR